MVINAEQSEADQFESRGDDRFANCSLTRIWRNSEHRVE